MLKKKDNCPCIYEIKHSFTIPHYLQLISCIEAMYNVSSVSSSYLHGYIYKFFFLHVYVQEPKIKTSCSHFIIHTATSSGVKRGALFHKKARKKWNLCQRWFVANDAILSNCHAFLIFKNVVQIQKCNMVRHCTVQIHVVNFMETTGRQCTCTQTFDRLR